MIHAGDVAVRGNSIILRSLIHLRNGEEEKAFKFQSYRRLVVVRARIACASVPDSSNLSKVNRSRSVFMLVTICPKCNSPRLMIVKPKMKWTEPIATYCPEC